MDLKLIVRGLWDRIGGWALIALGGLALLLGWVGVSGTPLPSEQIPYVVSGGLAGLAFIGVGATLLLSADLRDEWRKLDSLEEAVRAIADRPAEEQAAPGPDPARNGAARKRAATTSAAQP